LVATGDAEEPLVTWVLGSSGLLGGAVLRDHEQRGFPVITSRIPWRDHTAAVDALLDVARRLPENGWRIVWCAGAGVVGASQDALDAEVRVIEDFLRRWDPGPSSGPRTVFLASSAGGVYAGSLDPPFTESTTPRPLAPYGHAKLRIEELFTAHAGRWGTGLLVGRIANLYGPGQDLSKQQGLISLLCHALVTREQLSIYVSLDTLRDYLYVDDAAAMISHGLDAVQASGGMHTKVLASGSPMSISEILGHLTRLSRRRPPVVLGASPVARFQARDLRLRSRAWPHLDHLVRTPVGVGMANCLSEVRTALRTAERA
jgi:UDP-glucose 4-epimerase